MADGLYIALSGAIAQEQSLDTTAQNLANASSPGYQRARAVFSEVLQGQNSSAHYTQLSKTALDTTMGPVAATGRDLDASLPQERYLAVSTGRGERYTRAVHLDIATDGTLESGQCPVLSEGGAPIKVQRDGGPVTLAADGSVMQAGNAVGRLKIVSFDKPSALAREGANLLTTTTESGTAKTTPSELQVGALEQSNAQPVLAMTDLVNATRHFEAFQRALDAFRDADRKVVTTVPGT